MSAAANAATCYCGKPAHVRGMCRQHYGQWLKENADQLGGVSDLRARRAAARLRALADAIEGALGVEDAAETGWPKALRREASYLTRGLT